MRTLWTSALVVGLGLVAIGCGGGRHAVKGPPSAWMDERVATLAHTGDPAAEQKGELLRAQLHGDKDLAEWLVHLEEGSCYWIVGVGDQRIEKLSIYMWDVRGSRAESDRSGGPNALMKYCPSEKGAYRIQAKSGKGWGHVAVGVYGVVQPKAAVVTEELTALIDKEAAADAPGALRSGEFFVGAGDQSEWAVALAPGTCYWIIGIGQPEKVKRLELYLWDPRQRRVTESHNQNNIAVIGHCPEQPGMFKFQAKVQSGSGAYKVGVYARKQ